MKILKIEFQNINSLRGAHQIDFTDTPFRGNALFAITGPTGSGKSSILDVIALALFNNVPRLGKISTTEITRTGALITRNQTAAKAAVTYQGKSGSYRSEWSISTARTGNLRDYHMQLSHAETGELLDLKKSEVPAKNEELIGLNYNQFIKSVLLAQGEFAQLLKAKKDERGELLEKITGTGIYRQLGIRAFQKHREVSSSIEAQQNRMDMIRENLLSRDQEKEISENLLQKEKLVKALEKEIDQQKKRMELKKDISRKDQEIKQQTHNRDQARDALDKFEKENGLPLREHERIEEYAENIRNWSLQHAELLDLDQEIRANGKKKEKNSVRLKDCLSDASSLLGERIPAHNLEEAVEAFCRKVNRLKEEQRAKRQEYTAVKNQLLSETRDLAFELDERDPTRSKSQLLQLEKTAAERISELRKELSGVDLTHKKEEKENLRTTLDLAQEAWRSEGEINNLHSANLKNEQELKLLQSRLQEIPTQLEKARNRAAFFRERRERLHLQKQNELLQARLEDQRHILHKGSPCPLCGALDHPYATNLPEKNDALDADLKQAEQEFREWERKFNASQAELEHGESREKILRKELEKAQKNLKQLEKHFSNKYSGLTVEKKTDWQVYCQHLRQRIQQLEDLEQEEKKHRITQEGLPLLEKFRTVIEEGKKRGRELCDLYQGKDINVDTDRIKKQWVSLQQEGKNLEAREKELEEKQQKKSQRLEKLEADLLPEVRKKGFESLNAAKSALIPEAQCRSLRQERETLRKKIEAAIASLDLLTEQLKRSKESDTEASVERITQALKKNQEEHLLQQSHCRELFSQLKQQRNNQEQLERIEKEIAEKQQQIRPWRLLNELIGDSTGKKFNDFAQDLSLNQLLHLANLRIRDLSDRYSIDKPGDGEDDSLIAIDEHMGGQRRSVKTLSGGETFILSLSMALALSDLASRSVEINSLFIDEGFGTLDPETLDQTLDTLEKLQAESSKTIGIISHVDSLKERIGTQIQLTRNGQGYSSLEIRG